MKKDYLFIVLASCITLLLVVMSNGCKTASDYYGDGMMYANEGKYEQAIIAYSKAIDKEPDTILYITRANLYYHMVKIKFNNDYLNKAKADYEMVIRLEERVRQGNSLRANYARDMVTEIKIRQNPNVRIAQMVLEGVEGLSIDEEIWVTYAKVAMVYAQEKLFRRAIEYCNDGLEIKPDYQNLLATRAHCYIQIKEYNKAIDDYTTAINFNPNDHELYNGRGNVYSMMDDFDKAITEYDIALRINPDHISSLNLRGLAYSFKKDFAKGIADFETVLRLDPNNSLAKQLLEMARNDQRNQ